MVTTLDMEIVDRKLLNILQGDFPLVTRPYASIGEQLGVPEESVLDHVGALKRTNIVREISAIFDGRRMGYQSCLVAMRFPDDILSSAANVINQHAGVSHNYARRSFFNLWFTLSVGPDASLEAEVASLAEKTSPLAVRLLPALQVFKIGVAFDMVAEESASVVEAGHGEARTLANEPELMTEVDKALVRQLQQDLPLCPYPFAPMADALDLCESTFLTLAERLKSRGVLRRYGAVLHHRRAGFKANAMTAWRVPQEQVSSVGRLMAQHPAVSHCYERPIFPDWPYALFTMVHATTQQRCEETIADLSRLSGIPEYAALYSYREFKKTRVRYFV